MFSILIIQFSGNLIIIEAPHPQPLFSNNQGVNFEFKFFQNTGDEFNRGIACITDIVVLHAYLKRSYISLTFSRHQLMHSVFCIVPCV